MHPEGREEASEGEGENMEKEEEKRQEAGARNSLRIQGESAGKLSFPIGSRNGMKRQRIFRPEADTTRLQRKRKRGGEFMPQNRRTPKRKTREKTYRNTKEDRGEGRVEVAAARPEIKRDKQEMNGDSAGLSKIFPARVKSEGAVESFGMGRRRRMREAPFSPGGRSRLHHIPLRRQTRQIHIIKRKVSSNKSTHKTKYLGDGRSIKVSMYMGHDLPRLPFTNWTLNRRSIRCGNGESTGHYHYHYPPCLVTSRLSAQGAKLVHNRYRNVILMRPPTGLGRSSGEEGGEGHVERLDKKRQKRERTGNNAQLRRVPPLPPNVIDGEKEENGKHITETKNQHNYDHSDSKTTTTTTTTTHHNHSHQGTTPARHDNTSPTQHTRSKRDTNRNTNQSQKNLVYVQRYKAMNGRCDTYNTFSMHEENGTVKKEDQLEEEEEEKDEEAVRTELEWRRRIQSLVMEMRRDVVHVAETVVSVVVKDVNDNAPVFPNTTMYGEVQENGPISEYR